MEFEGPFDTNDVATVYQTNDFSHLATEVYLEMAASAENMLALIHDMNADRVTHQWVEAPLTAHYREDLLEYISELSEALEMINTIEDTGSVPLTKSELAKDYPKALYKALEKEMKEEQGEVDYGEIARIFEENEEQSED